MLYLLDANVLIDANRDYYSIERVPEFWEWLKYLGSNGVAKIPIETYDEVRRGRDALSEWMREEATVDALEFPESVDVRLVQHVTETGYGANLSDVQIEAIGRDPFLVAYCLIDPSERCVVTTETSRPSRVQHNRHLPDVCASLGVRSIHTFQLLRVQNFSTSWRGPR